MESTLSIALKTYNTTDQVMQKAIEHLRDQVQVNGRVSLTELDKRQLPSFELAWCASELTAARASLLYLEDLKSSSKDADVFQWECQLAFVYLARTVSRIQNRLMQRLNEYGLSFTDLQPLHEGEVGEFCQTYQSSSELQSMGQQVQDHKRDHVTLWTNEEQELMRETFAKLADEVVAPLAEEIHRHDLDIPDSIINPLLEMGIFGLSIPEQYGGLCSDEHEDTIGMIVATEELSRGSLGAAGSLITRPEILARALLAGGTEEQKAHWLPKLAMGDPFCAVAVTEPNYGSDVAGMQFRATKVEGGWRLNGVKTWCTFGGKAGVLLVLARTEPDPDLGHKGLSLLLAEKPSFQGHEFTYEQPEGGQITGRAIPTIGYRGMHSFETFFDNYFVPDSHLIGGEGGRGHGFYYMMAGFSGGRIQTAARAIGLMQAAVDDARTYASERSIFGQTLDQYGLTQVKLAQLAAQLAAARKLTYHVGRLMNEGKGQMEASLAKLLTCRSAEEVTREAMQIYGGMGYAEETNVSRFFVDARVLSIFEGAEEVLALRVIARQLFS